MNTGLSTLELCAGAGGEALGLEQAGIEHAGLIEIDKYACETLRMNRPKWKVLEQDLFKFTDASAFKGVDIVSGGPPCPPFSKAGKQLGHLDERNLFPVAIDIIDQLRPRAVMIESVRGILDAVFDDYRKSIKKQLKKLGYKVDWKLLQASDFGVPQLRPRVIFVALPGDGMDSFTWPDPHKIKSKTVGETLYDLMAADGWKVAKLWKERADEIAPTIVGGSKKHGGPDLGPTRAKRAWAELMPRRKKTLSACRALPCPWSRASKDSRTIGSFPAGRPMRTVRWVTPSPRQSQRLSPPRLLEF
jgi:DNA (cytosine-5)-methyltransferase 1